MLAVINCFIDISRLVGGWPSARFFEPAGDLTMRLRILSGGNLNQAWGCGCRPFMFTPRLDGGPLRRPHRDEAETS
jgi:hypothetical protein